MDTHSFLLSSFYLLFAIAAVAPDATFATDIDYGTPMYTSEYRAEIITKRSPLPVPPESSDLYNKLTDYSDKVVLLIHTVNENEFWSAVDHFGPPTPMLRYDDGTVVKRLINFHKVRIYLGEFGGYKAALIQTKMGADCRYEIEEALEIFPNVQAVLALGIGYGNDRGDVMFGDVLVSLKIQDVSNVKFNKDDLIIPRGEITEVRPVLVDIFAKNRKAFAVKTGFVCTEEGRPPSIEDGLVVSAPWLIDNADIKERLLASQPEAIGGEMEGWVLISIQKYLENWESNPRHIGVIVIKGVVDFGDGSKDRNWQMTGAMASIGFADFQLKQTMGQAFDAADASDGIAVAVDPDRVPSLDELTHMFIESKGVSVSVISSAQNRWKKLANYLGLEEDTIMSLTCDTERSTAQKAAVVFELWLRGEGREDRNWLVVTEFLKDMKLKAVARKVSLALAQ